MSESPSTADDLAADDPPDVDVGDPTGHDDDPPDSDTDDSVDNDRADAPQPPSWARWGLIAVAVVPFVTAAVRAIANDWFPIGDSALLYIRATDVGTRHHPWLGSWSSASVSLGTNINNPGPIYADLISPFAHVFGAGVGNVLGVTVVNVACLVGAAAAARRIGGWRFERWILVAGAGLAWMMGSELLFDIFQAHALLFPFLLMLVLVGGVLSGARWPWPWLAGVASLILQTHISYAYIAAVVGAATFTVVVMRLPSPRWKSAWSALSTTTARWTAVVVAVVWAQPVIEQLFGEGRGNLSRLAANASGTDVSVGLGNATRLVAAIVSLPPFWSRPGFADTIERAQPTPSEGGLEIRIPGLPDTGLALMSLALLVALLVVVLQRARRRGDAPLIAMSLLSITGVVGGIIALSRLTVGPVGLAPHHFRWVFVIGLIAHVTLVWAAVEWLIPRLTPHAPGAATALADTTVVTALVVVMFSIANIPMFAQQHGPTDDAHTMPAMRQLFEPLDDLQALQPLLYRSDNLRLFEPYSSAVQLQLRVRGIEFRVDDEVLVRQLGNNRRAGGDTVATLAQYERWDVVGGNLPGCVLVRASALDPAVDAEFEAGAQALADRIVTTGFDAGGVLIAADADERDIELATRFNTGDIAAVREVTYDGRLRGWIEREWAAGPAEVVAELMADGPAITEWLDSTVALVVTPDDVCAGPDPRLPNASPGASTRG